MQGLLARIYQSQETERDLQVNKADYLENQLGLFDSYECPIGGGRFFVWENVPGAFTSGSERGADFRAVLESIAETDIPMPKDGRWAAAGMVQCPKCEIAWRVLDAQYWGVPQRRKRIFLVADFAATDRRAAKILFVSKSMSGNFEQGRETRKRVASTIEKSIRTASELVHRGGTFDIRISSDGTQNWRAHCYETDKSRSLDATMQNPDSNHGGVAILEDVNLSTVGGADVLECKQGRPHGEVFQKHSRSVDGNGLERRTCTCNGKQTVGSLCAHDGRGFNGQDVSNDKLIVETMNESI